MTNSEPPSTPEEKWTAYLDGKLSAKEAAAFEGEHAGAAAERAANMRLMETLRRNSPAPKLRNAEFFNECILRAISPREAAATEAPRALWPLWRLVLGTACCLALVAVIYGVFVRGGDSQAEKYFAQVLSAKAGDEMLDATVLDADGIAIVWIDGLEQLPADYVLE